MKKPFHQRVSDFLEGKGFYIVLFLCVAAIGISGYYLFTSLTLDGPDVAAEGPARITVTPTPRPAATPAATAPVASATPRPTPQAAATPVQTPAATATPTVFAWPVQGEILTGFSLEVLSYDPTMEDWRTHAGLDLSASAGTEVRAAASGTVADVFDDVMLGTTVILDHGGGLTSTYANLASVPTVEVGDSVLTGQVIGSVGNSAIAESALPGHLHFTMAQDGTPVDPLEYLPE